VGISFRKSLNFAKI